MIKTFCDVCGKLGGKFDISVTKSTSVLKISMVVTVIADFGLPHICDPCARDMLQEAVDKINARISTSTEPAYSPL